MKKQLTVLVLAGILLLSLGGCGLFGSAKEKGISEDENTLTVWCWDETSYVRAMEKAESLYQQEHPEFKLEITEYSWEKIKEKLKEAKEENDPEILPDIVLIRDNYIMDEDQGEMLKDLFLPLDESGIDFSKFDQEKVQQTTKDKEQYGLPFDLGTVVMALRSDLLEKAGYITDQFTDITWEQFCEYGKTVKEKTGIAMLTVIRDRELQEMIPENIYREMKDSGVLIEVDSEDQYVSAITGEEAVAVIDTCHIFGEIMAASIAEGSWVVTDIPAEENDSHYLTTGGCSWMVTKNTEKEEMVFDFLKETFGSSSELYAELMEDQGLMGSYLPLRETETYQHPVEYFSNQTLFILLTDFNERALNSETVE